MKKVLSAVLALAVSGALFAGCASPGASASSKAGTAAGTGATGKVSLTGSSSMQELMEGLIEAYKEVEPGVTVECQYPGSGQGITAVTEGKVDIGNASRELKAEEAANLEANIVAIDGIAVALNPANKADDISVEQLAKIYTGEIKNWKEVGGDDKAIIVIGRDAASGTREAFESIVGVKEKCKYSQELTSTGAVKTAVASNPDAIGYVSLNAVDNTVKASKIGGAEANEASILDGSYKLSRPFVMATSKTKTLSAPAKAFLDFVKGEKGQEVVKSLGLIVKK
ncbi:phosphate ABC transporter substrate-binding protein [Acetanaerobacterium elongatum]|uniref:Phosphate-binding protein n=1 Tax=Acetanaerobacterium elongatum TaxID=258515 RepID=A0A1H0GXZ7_9FIRM|nr:phosphate ABC transporter substrate-binding protein [Acetanaerobacterium elongatum]SDO11750.1 phosphate ABC transporter substrate-binding protein, PhoT family [Acetanaerobacterium elongatum]